MTTRLARMRQIRRNRTCWNNSDSEEEIKKEVIPTNDVDFEKLGIKKCNSCRNYFNKELQKNNEGHCKNALNETCINCLNDPNKATWFKCYKCEYCDLIGIKKCYDCGAQYNKYDINDGYCSGGGCDRCLGCKAIKNLWCGKCDNCNVAKNKNEILKCGLCGLFKCDADCNNCDLCGLVKCQKCDVKLFDSLMKLNQIKNRFEFVNMKVDYYVCECIHKGSTEENYGTLPKPGCFTKAAIKL